MAATNDVTAGMRYLSNELRLELRAATELLRRTILPPPSAPAGEQLVSIDAEVRPGNSVVLAHWKGPQGGDGCTVYGSRAASQATVLLPAEVQAQLQVRRGSVVRVERWPWPEAGFIRRVAAEEIIVAAVPAASYVSVEFYRLGVAVQSGIAPRDTSLVLGSAPAAGLITPSVFAPQCAQEFRILNVDGGGSFQFAHETAVGVLTAFGALLPSTFAEDWTPWNAGAAGIVIDSGSFTVEFAI